MRMVNQYVDGLVKDTRQELRQQMKNDPAAYKELMKNLLIQVCFHSFLFFILSFIYVGFDQTDGATSVYQMQKGRCCNY